jgi:hypothetical protein
MKSFKQFLLEEFSPINDEWFQHEDTITAFKPPKPINYEIAREVGVVETLEGPVKHEAGHVIVTGPKGEKYPIAPEKFKTLYDVAEDGTATPKRILKQVRLADHDGVLKTSWGDLNYKAGQHMIVRHGPGDYGAVELGIFGQTYQEHNPDISAAPQSPHESVQTAAVEQINISDFIRDRSIVPPKKGPIFK